MLIQSTWLVQFRQNSFSGFGAIPSNINFSKKESPKIDIFNENSKSIYYDLYSFYMI